MREWNFDHDNGSTPVMDKAREYVANWSLMRNEGIDFFYGAELAPVRPIW